MAGVLLLLALMQFSSIGMKERQSIDTPAAATPTDTGTTVPTPRVVHDTVQAGATDIWLLRFTGLRPARVLIKTPAPQRISCRVRDSAGSTLVERESSAGTCALEWTPARTGAYHIEVSNMHDLALPYSLTIRR